MKTIQPFIDLGFYTVPLTGELKRGPNGKKTIPHFQNDWRVKFQETFNQSATELGGTITGSISGIIAIDCDSQRTYDLFRTLDPENEFLFVSKGKPEGGGTIIYSFPENEVDVVPNFKVVNDVFKLDFYSDNGFVYLPTDANTTKEKWKADTFDELPKLMGMPPEIHTLLKTLYEQTLNVPVETETAAPKPQQAANYLAPALELMLSKDEFSPTLFRILTPKDFRDLPQYTKLGYLHPENVPNGRGSEYLMKISAILGKDSSVNKDLYEEAMVFINNLWDDPLPRKRIYSTIIHPMLSGKSSINGEPIWTYDKEWKTRGFSFINKLGEAVEIFFDDVRCTYYLMNFSTASIMAFDKDTECFSYIETVGLGLPARKEFKGMMPLVRTVNDPSKNFGFYQVDEYTRIFNIFQQTPQLMVLRNPEPYAEMYKKPKITLEYIRHLIPHTPTRRYVLGFLKRKLTTFDYSPVVLYFLGISGSGKDTFVSLLSYIIGDNYIAKPTTKEFLEQYNGFLLDKHFVQLDEYGNQLARHTDKQEALGKLKAYTGKKTIQIRQMRSDGYPYKQTITFIMTANNNPLLLEENDRRALIIETPNIMANSDWVINAGGLDVVQSTLEKESIDFCYYLATEVDEITSSEYVTPLQSKSKHKIIATSLAAGPRLAYYFTHGLIEEVEKLATDNEVYQLFNHSAECRIYEDDLFQLYSMITDFNGVKRGLSLAMTDAGIAKVPTTKDGQKSYYYKIPALKYYTTKPTGEI